MEANLTVILIAAVCAGLYMSWGIGANDVANSMGTSVGSGAITVGTAIVIAGVFEFLGAFLAGGEVTSTIRKGIIDADALGQDSDLLVIGMLSALLAAAVWLTVASRYGWPVSTTHSIVGAIIGFAVVAVGFEAVRWGGVAKIVASWVVTPILAGAISFLLVLSVQWLIFNKDDPRCLRAPVRAGIHLRRGAHHLGRDVRQGLEARRPGFEHTRGDPVFGGVRRRRRVRRPRRHQSHELRGRRLPLGGEGRASQASSGRSAP